MRNKNAARKQSPSPTAASELKPIKPERFVDLSVFYLSLSSFLSAQGNKHPHSRKGMVLLRKAQSQMESGLELIVRPLVDTQRVPQLKSHFQKAMVGASVESALDKAQFLSAFYRKLSTRMEVVQDVFSGKSRTPIMQLVDVVQQETPAAILHNLSAIAPVSGIQTFHQWVVEAASILGASLTPMESIVVDTASAVSLARQIRDVDANLATTSPVSEEAANLQGEKQRLSRKLEQVVENSDNPNVVLSGAVNEINKNKETGYLTEIGKRLGHTPDQEAAMMVSGKSIIAAGAGSGKCVTGETIVSTPNGPKRIDECAAVSTTLSVDVSHLSTGWKEAQWLDMGVSETLEVQTRSGILLRGTPEHPLLVWGSEGKAIWKTLASLEPEVDHVLLLPGFARETGTTAVDHEEAYLYGLLMGDGWVDVKQGRVSWSRGGEYLPPHYYRLMADIFEVTPKAHPKRDTQSVTHEVWSRKLVTLLQEKGLAFASARDKSIPAYLVSATDAERIRFLQGLFDTDGTATGDREFEWLSASETLARQVHQMLLGLGVVGLLRPKHVKEYPDHTYWRVFISGEHLRTFQEVVGFRYEFKKSADLQDLCQKDCNPNIGTYPHVGNLLKEVRETWKSQQRWDGRKQSLLMDERWVQVKHYLLGSREPSREKLQSLIQGCESEATTTLGSLLQFYPDAVVAVKPFGKQAVYDFTVPETHSFIANGIVSHNTRVLASKVAWHIEQGVAPSQIIATSFAQKSAAELFERIEKYGSPITDDVAKEGYGTTHSVARSLIKRFAPNITMRPLIEKGLQSKLIRLAMEQVQMTPLRAGVGDPDPEESFFPPVGTAGPGGPAGDIAAEDPETPDMGTEYERAVLQALQYHQRLDARIGPQGWLNWTLGFLNDMLDQDPAKFTPSMKASLNKALGRVKSVSYRIAGASQGADKSYFYKNPANQWFNIGRKPLMDDMSRPIGARRFGTAISGYKANLETPGKLWAETGGNHKGEAALFTAVYGAYEWLKSNDTQFGGGYDHDDTLINAAKVLVGNPKALEYALARWKVVLVDEAQDLNQCQHVIFGLISGYFDPNTQKPYEDGRLHADTYTFIGDDKQCVADDTPVLTPSGPILAKNLRPGDKVLSYRNGEVVPQTVRHNMRSDWDHGLRVITESGKELLMSPNHKLWATNPQLEDEQHIVYLMWREDFGFRVGVTNNGRDDSHLYLYGQRPVAEKADKFWVLDITENRDSALLLEDCYSLEHQIPKAVYHTNHRNGFKGSYEKHIQKIFARFGHNGVCLLEKKELSFDLPHWVARTFVKAKKYTIQVVAHGPKGTQVNLECGPEVDLGAISFKKRPQDRKLIRKWFGNYREALQFVDVLQKQTGALVAKHLSSPAGSLRMLTASALYPGMELVLYDGEDVEMDAIISVDPVDPAEGVVFLDLDVEDASNFFACNLLVSNSIYEFRGATPEKFIEMSDLVPGGAGFTTKVLEVNFRSGAAIVDAANRLIAHNTKQIPMVCRAAERNGMGSINYVDVATHASGAAFAAERIQELTSGDNPQFGVQDFGVAVRTNAEAFAFGVEMLKRGMPFRSRMSFFGDDTTKALVAWMRIADAASLREINQGVLEAHRTPRFGLDDVFGSQLQKQARGKNYYEYLVSGGWRNIYTGEQGWRNAKLVKPYVDALQRVQALKSTASPQEILDFILNMEGAPLPGGKPPQSTITSLIEKVKGSPDAMDLLVQEVDGGEVTEDSMRGLALAPVAPLMGLLEGYEDIGPAMKFIQKLQHANEKKHKQDSPNASDYAEPAVVIDTVHGWKGLETKNLFIPMAKDVFPHVRSKESERDMASERRLAYVAITRGKESVTIIAPAESHTGKPAGPSEFVFEACIPSVTSLAEENPALAQEMGKEPAVEVPAEEAPVKKPRRRTRKQSSRTYTEAEFEAYLRGDTAFFESMDLEKQWNKPYVEEEE